MGNIGITIQRFLGNKNTVTIIGVLAGIVVLYFGYNWRVNQAVSPVTVPCAKVAIKGNTQITSDMLIPGGCKVPKSLVDTSKLLVTESGQVTGKYVKYDTTIAEGSLFYESLLIREKEVPNFIFKDIDEGYTVYSLAVNLHSTYGNSIMEGNYIDLYFSAVDDDNYVVFGKFIESIRVLAVKDQQGHHVFSSSSNGIPTELLFAVPDEYFQLLRKTDYIKTNRIEITPVPRNQNYTEKPGDTKITSEEIKAFINAKAIDAQQNEGTSSFENNETETGTE